MVKVLVVDDSAIDRRLAAGFLRRAGMEAVHAEHGADALDRIGREAPDIVLTDLQMPEMDGLELVEAIRRSHSGLPVVLMTAHGSEEIAVQALRRGAASYVPKRDLANTLVSTVQQILEVARRERQELILRACLHAAEWHFELDNDVSQIPAVVGHLEQSVVRLGLCDEAMSLQVAVALREVLVNAIYHGNLELSSALLEHGAHFDELVRQRRCEQPYCDRRVRLTARETREEATYVVTDEGPGFDPSTLPDPLDLENLEKPSGRGLLLVRTFMDEVTHNSRGNEITLILRRRPPDDG
ncbi:ATP-binding response regulator [Chondromyces apiculatus]|uniref:Sigma-54 dependent transcriptional regulator n=1 Tax=Chondromyces apiculatus DSM 436 TaxID=1192034 RepID=A0A017T0A4_9BACT|nr:response regulator [Chondromyces apiculatus]EYF02290.1 Sigma-54 dependent transcriptional regulator [Chondromyces apiculatus DSM 436]